LWPYSVSQDVGLVEHVVHAPLCVLACWATLRATDGGARQAFAAGVVSALAVLARLTFTVTAPFLALVAVRRRGPAAGLALVAGFAAIMTPWILRNVDATGHAVIGTDGGRALWVGNAPATFLHYPAASIDEGERELFRRLGPEGMAGLRSLAADEVAQDARFRSMAVDAMSADPAGTAWRALRKAGALWSPVHNPGPAAPAKQLIFAATIVPLLAGAAAAAATCGRLRADLPAVFAVAGSVTLSAMTFWGQSRYLAPLHGIALAMIAAWLARRPETTR
jgi:hypothetical protein